MNQLIGRGHHIPILLHMGDVLDDAVGEGYDEFAFAAVFDRVVYGLTALGDDTNGWFFAALCDAFLKEVESLLLVAPTQVMTPANDNAVKRFARHLAKFDDVLVASVARAV